MMEFTAEMSLLLASTTAVGVLMMRAGIEKKLLEWRRRDRICAGCGKPLDRPVCTCASPRES
jgi:NADH pyrophosphatase NudC (nudix superfamily)